MTGASVGSKNKNGCLHEEVDIVNKLYWQMIMSNEIKKTDV